MGLEAGIWASRLKYGPGGWGRGGAEEEKEKEEEEEEEKIPHMCESIGHRPLRGRCPAPPSTSTQARAIRIGYCIGFTILTGIGFTQYYLSVL